MARIIVTTAAGVKMGQVLADKQHATITDLYGPDGLLPVIAGEISDLLDAPKVEGGHTIIIAVLADGQT
jgi:hypothetical protein